MRPRANIAGKHPRERFSEEQNDGRICEQDASLLQVSRGEQRDREEFRSVEGRSRSQGRYSCQTMGCGLSVRQWGRRDGFRHVGVIPTCRGQIVVEVEQDRSCSTSQILNNFCPRDPLAIPAEQHVRQSPPGPTEPSKPRTRGIFSPQESLRDPVVLGTQQVGATPHKIEKSRPPSPPMLLYHLPIISSS